MKMWNRKIVEKMYSKLEERDGRYYRKREVFPTFSKEGKIIWKNFLIGNKRNIIFWMMILLIAVGLIYEYTTNIKLGAECIARENALKNLTRLIP